MTQNQLPWTNATTAYGLLNAVIRISKEVPERMDMRVVCYRGESIYKNAWRFNRIPDCNAIGCVAGWSLILTGNTYSNEWNSGNMVHAREILGLTPDQATELFNPEELVSAKDAQTPEHTAAVIKHIRAFQKKYKAQLQATKITIKQNNDSK